MTYIISLALLCYALRDDGREWEGNLHLKCELPSSSNVGENVRKVNHLGEAEVQQVTHIPGAAEGI